MANRGNVQYTEAINLAPSTNQDCDSSIIRTMCDIIKINLQEATGYEAIRNNPNNHGTKQPRLVGSGYEAALDSIRNSAVNGSNMIASQITNLLNIENNLISRINYGYVYTTPGNYSLTVPPKVAQITIAACGGGGGAAVSGAFNYSSATGFEDTRAVAGSGGSSGVYNLLIVTGGGGGNIAQLARGVIDGNPHTDAHPGAAGSPNGTSGNVGGDNDNRTETKGGDGKGLSYGLVGGGYGKGGNTATDTAEGYWVGSATGGGGGWNVGTFNVSTGQVLNIVVGGGGASAINQKYAIRRYYHYNDDDYTSSYDSTGNEVPAYYASAENGTSGYVLIKFTYTNLSTEVGGNKDHNIIRTACEYLLAVSQYFDSVNGCWDSSNMCALSCQVSCQSSCQVSGQTN